MGTTMTWRRRLFLVLVIVGILAVFESEWTSPSTCDRPTQGTPNTWKR